MKVAYDISVLGQGYVNPKARTGVYRVVESLFWELVNRKDIDVIGISLNQSSGTWNDVSCSLYIDENLEKLQKYYQSSYKNLQFISQLLAKAVNLQKKLVEISLKKHQFFYKPSLAIQIPFEKLLNLFLQPIVKINEFQIYHSPFDALHKIQENKISRILTIYDLIPILNPEKFTQNKYRQFLNIIDSINKQQDWITCISENTKQDFCNYTGMNPDRVFVTPLAAAQHFYPVDNLEIIIDCLKKYKIPNQPYLLSLCTLEPRKNLSFLIRCFAQILNDDPSLEINLVLVGIKGWKNADIFETVQTNPQLRNRVIFTGYIPDEDLSAIYSGATAFVYPSLYEGFGLPPLEAMQCGTPVITSNTSSLPEVVGNAGIMIDPKQEDDLCQAMLNVINNSQLRASLSQKGIQKASQFSWAKCAEETVKVYRLATEHKND
ncbi:glycosyltransferase family 4 protein [Gloeothece verrucosa]|uniref:Glycosyl transferase group 1 n=1 Tax=Gloeothece verrucosa (strain PCC 7822) TaxID=497965 RepID=E0U830_GLOV7|nr:glycosyltransferase family 1 protein [Gloeothece verrucosa]ADN17235.1 glycosyl transferase group 1 [Gloeothece verrucosa PCC 7822]